MSAAGFSPRDWELAPYYKSPGAEPSVVVLDFEHLSAMMAKEEAIGSFRTTHDGTLAKAPLYVNDMPAAFYRVDTNYAQFTPNHNTSERETLVVMRGVLKVVFNDAERTAMSDASMENMLRMGEVMDLADRSVAMQAVGVIDPAKCVAIALYRDRDIQVMPIL